MLVGVSNSCVNEINDNATDDEMAIQGMPAELDSSGANDANYPA